MKQSEIQFPLRSLNPRKPKGYNFAPLHVRQLMCRVPTAVVPIPLTASWNHPQGLVKNSDAE